MSKMSLTRTVSERLVNRLRNTNLEKFQTMCKMHLSFLLDLPGGSLEELMGESSIDTKHKWNLSTLVKRKSKDKSGEGLFRGPLTQEGINQIQSLITFLGKPENIKQEGLFRKSGHVVRQKTLKEKLSCGECIDFEQEGYSAHDCASVLKGFLGELPEPLLTEKHYLAHCQVPDMVKPCMTPNQHSSAEVKQVKTVQLLLQLLPKENATLLEYVFRLLHKVARVEENKMTADTLGTMFAPHLLVPRKTTASELHAVAGNITKAVSFMIEKAPKLFRVPIELVRDIAKYWDDMEGECPDCHAQHSGKSEDENENITSSSKKSKYKKRIEDNSEAVNTVISFTDRKASQEAGEQTSTQVALAQLYAHVQAMPESAKKRKLLKQFNRANGLGTPSEKHKRSKSLSGTLKRHILRNHRRHGSSHDSQVLDDSLSTGMKTPICDITNRSNVRFTPITQTPVLHLFKKELQHIMHTSSPRVNIVDLTAVRKLSDHPSRHLIESPLTCSSVDVTWDGMSLSDRNEDCTDSSENKTPDKSDDQPPRKRMYIPNGYLLDAQVGNLISPTASPHLQKVSQNLQSVRFTPRTRRPMAVIQSPV